MSILRHSTNLKKALSSYGGFRKYRKAGTVRAANLGQIEATGMDIGLLAFADVSPNLSGAHAA